MVILLHLIICIPISVTVLIRVGLHRLKVAGEAHFFHAQ